MSTSTCTLRFLPARPASAKSTKAADASLLLKALPQAVLRKPITELELRLANFVLNLGEVREMAFEVLSCYDRTPARVSRKTDAAEMFDDISTAARVIEWAEAMLSGQVGSRLQAIIDAVAQGRVCPNSPQCEQYIDQHYDRDEQLLALDGAVEPHVV